MFCRSVQVTVGKHNKCHHRMHRLIIVPYKSIPSAQNQPATSHPVVPVKTKSPLESSRSNGLNWNIVPRVIICRLYWFFLYVTNVLLNKGSNTGLNDLENRKCHFTKSCLVILLKVQIHETILAWPLFPCHQPLPPPYPLVKKDWASNLQSFCTLIGPGRCAPCTCVWSQIILHSVTIII